MNFILKICCIGCDALLKYYQGTCETIIASADLTLSIFERHSDRLPTCRYHWPLHNVNLPPSQVKLGWQYLRPWTLGQFITLIVHFCVQYTMCVRQRVAPVNMRQIIGYLFSRLIFGSVFSGPIYVAFVEFIFYYYRKLSINGGRTDIFSNDCYPAALTF